MILRWDKFMAVISWVARFEVWGITLWPVIICRTDMGKIGIDHEKIHLRQQKELFVLGFYLLYAGFYVYLRIKDKQDHEETYRNLPFEKEAYENQAETEKYLSARKWCAWRNYI